jgi:hypothetical protein
VADPANEPKYWVDELWEKHECGGYGIYSQPDRTEIQLEGRGVTLVMPFKLDPSRIVSVTNSEGGELLYLIAKEPRLDEDPPYVGVLIVARRRGIDEFAVVVWHILYGWALRYLGLDKPTL